MRPSIPPDGITVGAGARRLSAQIVAIHGDVERSDDRGAGIEGVDDRADPSGKEDTASRDAEKNEGNGFDGRRGIRPTGLKDLVGDPSQRSGDVSGLQHVAHSSSDLLPRLSGRFLKDVVFDQISTADA